MRRFIYVLAFVALLLTGCAAPEADAADTMSAYVAAYNSGDIDEIMVFFSEESIITGHPYPVEGKGLDGIRELHIADRQAAAADEPYMISNVEVVGDTVTWDQTWLSSSGQEYCHEGQAAVVIEGIILTWDWSSGSNCT